MRAAWKQRGVLIKNSSSLDEVSFGRDLRSPSLPLSSLLFSRVVREKTFLRSSSSRLQTSLSKPSASISSQRLRGSLRCFRWRKGEGARFPGLTSSPILTFATSAKKIVASPGWPSLKMRWMELMPSLGTRSNPSRTQAIKILKPARLGP